MIVVWFSCGVASAVAAKITLEKYKDVRIVNCPVAEEDDDNLRFKMDVEAWLGVSIETAVNRTFPKCSAVEVWSKRNFMSGPKGAPCTIELKKEARYQWEAENKPEHHVLGFTADERNRYERFIQTERENVLPVLIDAKVTKAQCFDIIRDAGIKRPRIYDQGYPNANCIGCVKATSPTYWNLVREKHPEVFADRAAQSREIGARLVRVNNKRIFLDELKSTDKGRAIKNFDCGVFCEEIK
jgi:hypothetical protein